VIDRDVAAGLDHAASQNDFCEYGRGRPRGTLHPAWPKTPQAATGADPDCAIGLRRKGAQVAVVPNQTVALVVLSPMLSIPNTHALVRSRPKPAGPVETEEVAHFSAKTLFAAVVGHRESFAIDTYAGDPAGKPIAHPNFVRADGGCRQNDIVLQAVGRGDVAPPALRQPEQAPGSASQDLPAGTRGDYPAANRWYFRHAPELLLGKLRHEQACLGRRPEPLGCIQSQRIRGFRGEAVSFVEPLDSAIPRVDSTGPGSLRAEPEVAIPVDA